VILAAWYMLRLCQGAMLGPAVAGLDRPAHGVALRTNELLALLPLVALIVWIGVAPGGWLYAAASAARAIVGAVGGAQ
jgi:NADH:ubiquinone oxidoreductase subunit 4 (subunit M)